MRIATVDSVTGHIIEATLSTEARGTPIKGCFVTLESGEDLFLGRVLSVDLTNAIHQDPTFAPYIMQHGAVPHWSGEVDIERANIEIIRVIDTQNQPVAMRRNPSSGTMISLANEDQMRRFATESTHALVVGTIPNSNALPATIRNRDFGAFNDSNRLDRGGWGEGQHTVIYGQNGSGKSVLATMIAAGKVAAHPEMGLLIPDTQGDLSNPHSYERGDYQWNYLDVLRSRGIRLDPISINEIRLSSKTTFRFKLSPLLKHKLSVAEDKAIELASRVASLLTDRETVGLQDITSDNVLAAVEQCFSMPGLYTAQTAQQKLQMLKMLINTPALRRDFDTGLDRIRSLFDGRYELGELVDQFLSQGRKILIDLYSGFEREDQGFVLHELMAQLPWRARRAFTAGGERACNALCLLDEATRWIPEGRDDDPNGVSTSIRRSCRETRKYGLGWMFIAQSPSGVSKDVLRESRTKYFGRNLGVGVDAVHLKDILGQEGLDAYRQLDMQGGIFWIGIGEDNNVGTESRYFTFHPFGGNATQAFMDANPQIFQNRP